MKTLVLDWGIGGLSVYRKLKQLAPRKSYVYLSDSGSAPYGKQAARELAARLNHLVARASERWKISHVVIACNAASTVVADVKAPVGVTGMIDAGVRMVEKSGYKKIGVESVACERLSGGCFHRDSSRKDFESSSVRLNRFRE